MIIGKNIRGFLIWKSLEVMRILVRGTCDLINVVPRGLCLTLFEALKNKDIFMMLFSDYFGIDRIRNIII